MENNTSNSVMNIEQLVPEIQNYLDNNNSNTSYRKLKENFKKFAKYKKSNKRLKKIYPAAFEGNLERLTQKEIMFASPINPLSIELDAALIEDKSELKNFEINKSFFTNVNYSSDEIKPTCPYHDIYQRYNNGKIEINKSFDVKDVHDDDYQYYETVLNNIKEYSKGKKQLFFYRGNLFANGECYGSYTGHLENLAKINILYNRINEQDEIINDLKETIENLKETVENLKSTSIQRSELLTDSELQYLWTGTEEELQKINKDNKTIYFTAEEE